VYENDVVIFAASTGTGKRLDKAGAIHIKQIHPETGEFFYAGKVGSGFSDATLDELMQLCEKHSIPILKKDKEVEKLDLNGGPEQVCMIEFSERIGATGKFRFPVFIRFRDDKLPKECIAEDWVPVDDDEE
jgi:bifunctional non-homologous end joining protein LigD